MTLIDWTVLTALREDIGEEDFAEVAHIFVAEMEEKLRELRHDPGRAREEDFHYLRGSAANLGFSAMVGACTAAESACASGTPPDLDAVVRAFSSALAEARRTLPDLDAA